MEVKLYTFIDSQDNIIEAVRANSTTEALKRLSEIAKTLLIDYSIKKDI